MKQIHVDLCWLQTLSGGGGVLQERIPSSDALSALAAGKQQAVAGELGAGVVVYLRPSDDVLPVVGAELTRARELHAPLHSAHEALAVIREEYLEVEREVFIKEIDRSRLRKELIQLAAMAIRAVEDLEL